MVLAQEESEGQFLNYDIWAVILKRKQYIQEEEDAGLQ